MIGPLAARPVAKKWPNVLVSAHNDAVERENPLKIKGFWGAEGQNRTGDTSIFSAVLYRLSYLGLLT